MHNKQTKRENYKTQIYRSLIVVANTILGSGGPTSIYTNPILGQKPRGPTQAWAWLEPKEPSTVLVLNACTKKGKKT